MKPSGRSKKLAKSERNFQPLAQVQWNINLESLQTHADVFNRGRYYYVDWLEVAKKRYRVSLRTLRTHQLDFSHR